MKNLEELILDSSATQAVPDAFFAKFGLRRNPFPANRTIMPEVLYNQDQAITRFAEIFRQILVGEPQRRALAVLAGTGGGKTHFLRHCRWSAGMALERMSRALVFVEFQAGSGKLQDITREVLSACDSFLRDSRGEDFVGALVEGLSTEDDPLRLIRQEDLRAVAQNLLEAHKPGFKPKDRAGVFGFEVLRELSRRWLSGATLTQTEKKYLGVTSRIDTASYAVRVITETLKVGRHLGLFEGLVLCLDEIETIFTRGTRASHYQSFLQDLRYLYDESVKDGNGYSLLLVSASTQYGAQLLRQVNYPVFQRLGFEQDQRVSLEPVAGVDQAKLFAQAYIDFEQSQFKKEFSQKNSKHFPALLSDSDIEQSYLTASGPNPTPRKEISQAPLLDALHKSVEQKKTAENQS